MPKVGLSSSRFSGLKKVFHEAAVPVVVLSVVGTVFGGIFYAASHRIDREQVLLADAFNEGRNTVTLEDHTVCGLVVTRDENDNAVVSAHAISEFDGNGGIKTMGGDSKRNVTIPKDQIKPSASKY